MTEQHRGVGTLVESLHGDSTGNASSHPTPRSVTPQCVGINKPGRGAHRAPSDTVRSRAAVVAVAAGASFAAYQGSLAGPASDKSNDVLLLASDDTAAGGTGVAPSEIVDDAVTWADPSATGVVAALYEGQTSNAQREIEEEIARRPAVHAPAMGRITSGYGPRWGAFHGGIDIANEVGTPIRAATDGVVIDAGPAQGFGNWIRIMSDDGVMTVYGHMETLGVAKGQRVTAGQEIAGMGNRGFSTGSHLHFEVWLEDGKHRINPIEWFVQNRLAVEQEIGPIQAGEENLPLPGFQSSVGSLQDLAAQFMEDPANSGEGAPGLADAIRSTAQTTQNPADATELRNIAAGQPAVAVDVAFAAPMGPVAATQPAGTADSVIPTSLGAVAP